MLKIFVYKIFVLENFRTLQQFNLGSITYYVYVCLKCFMCLIFVPFGVHETFQQHTFLKLWCTIVITFINIKFNGWLYPTAYTGKEMNMQFKAKDDSK